MTRHYEREVPPVHHDGHGLNDDANIWSSAPERGGSPDHYLVVAGKFVHQVHFQHGPRHVEGSQDGLTHEMLLAILIDRCKGFEAGPFAHPKNAECLAHLEAALACLKARADERALRGVLGTYTP